MNTITIDLSAICHDLLIARTGIGAAFVAGELELDIEGEDYWDAEIVGVRLDSCPVDFAWLEAFDLGDVVDIATYTMTSSPAPPDSRVRNLVEETVEAVARFAPGETPEWVGSADGTVAMSWAEFCLRLDGVEYDAGHGDAEIAYDLVVVGDGWWLERTEHDGAEGWAFRRQPVRATSPAPLGLVKSRRVGGQSVPDLAKLGEVG